MAKEIFRKKSLERISSPEQLNDYIRVSNPSVWMLLSAIVLLLAGFVVFATVGKVEIKAGGVAQVENGNMLVYIDEEDVEGGIYNPYVKFGEQQYDVELIYNSPVLPDDSLTENIFHMGRIDTGSWVYVFSGQADIPDGIYEVVVVTNNLNLSSFIWE